MKRQSIKTNFMSFAPKVSKTFIFLGKITKITPISLYYDPPFYDFLPECRRPCLFDPLQLSTEEYSVRATISESESLSK